MAEDEQRTMFPASTSISATTAQWTSPGTHIYPHSHHGTPAQEYAGFNLGGPGPPTTAMDNGVFAPSAHRPMHQQLQPLVMPQWPSMLNSHAAGYQTMYPAPIQPMQALQMPGLATPASANSNRSMSTPRKTLTDHDRKRMCQYAEEHPNSKQTEIGAIFGVERSTVSKVLRQKEKYLFQDDGSRSPVKRAKGRSPDIERALAIWAKNHEKKGLPLTDDLIREKARAFAATTTTPENNVAVSTSWLEKFKLKNNLMGARSRKSSLAPDDADSISTIFGPPSATGTSPVSPVPAPSTSPIELNSAQSNENLKHESPDSYLDFSGRQPFHTQSTTSLNSAFTDTAPSSFSPGPLSPTSSFFTPDSGVAAGPFMAPSRSGLAISIVGSNNQRPRSQTFPLLDQYLLPTTTNDIVTPKYATTHLLDSPMEEASDPMLSVSQVLQDEQYELQSRPQTVTPSETMGPPPLPASIQRKRSWTPVTPVSAIQAATSPEEARNALQVVLKYFEQQPQGFLDLQESVTLGKLMEKLKLP